MKRGKPESKLHGLGAGRLLSTRHRYKHARTPNHSIPPEPPISNPAEKGKENQHEI
jgi:hypothetical protein